MISVKVNNYLVEYLSSLSMSNVRKGSICNDATPCNAILLIRCVGGDHFRAFLYRAGHGLGEVPKPLVAKTWPERFGAPRNNRAEER